MGNAAGGKSALARRLAQLHKLPLVHVDSLQFLPGLQIRPLNETRDLLRKVTEQDKWIIDGFGPLDLLEQHFALAERIIFIDLQIWRHFAWLAKRQISSLWKARPELPEGCKEASFGHTLRMIKTIWRIHTKMRPELLRILSRSDLKEKVIHIRSLKDWHRVAQEPSHRL